MIDKTAIFWMTVGPWLFIGGMTILVLFVHYFLFLVYKLFFQLKQNSSKMEKIILISGLAVISLGAIMPWLYVVGVLTVFAPK